MSRLEYEYVDRTVKLLEEDEACTPQEDADMYLRECSFLSMELVTAYLRSGDSYDAIPETIEKDQLEDWLRYVLLRRIAERKKLKSYFEDLNKEIGMNNG